MITRRALLGGAVALAGIRIQAVRFALAPDAGSAVAEGVRFGLEEASRATSLLGRSLDMAPDAGLVIEKNAVIQTGEGRFMLAATGEERTAAIDQAVAAGLQRSASLAAVHWHHSLFKYGASELNERFARRRGQKMSDEHWLGWMAVKVIAEAALRAGTEESLGAVMARARFDGHKGVALSFSKDARRLQQPLYVVDARTDAVVWPS